MECLCKKSPDRLDERGKLRFVMGYDDKVVAVAADNGIGVKCALQSNLTDASIRWQKVVRLLPSGRLILRNTCRCNRYYKKLEKCLVVGLSPLPTECFKYYSVGYEQNFQQPTTPTLLLSLRLLLTLRPAGPKPPTTKGRTLLCTLAHLVHQRSYLPLRANHQRLYFM